MEKMYKLLVNNAINSKFHLFKIEKWGYTLNRNSLSFLGRNGF